MLLPATADRVTRNTAEAINERIRRDMEARVAQLADRGPEALEQRLAELDEEWDIERAVETLAPSLTLTGLLLAATRKPEVADSLRGGAGLLPTARAAGLVPAGADPCGGLVCAPIRRSTKNGRRSRPCAAISRRSGRVRLAGLRGEHWTRRGGKGRIWANGPA